MITLLIFHPSVLVLQSKRRLVLVLIASTPTSNALSCNPHIINYLLDKLNL